MRRKDERFHYHKCDTPDHDHSQEPTQLVLSAEEMRNLLPPIQHEMSNCIHPFTSCNRCTFLKHIQDQMTDRLVASRERG